MNHILQDQEVQGIQLQEGVVVAVAVAVAVAVVAMEDIMADHMQHRLHKEDMACLQEACTVKVTT